MAHTPSGLLLFSVFLPICFLLPFLSHEHHPCNTSLPLLQQCVPIAAVESGLPFFPTFLEPVLRDPNTSPWLPIFRALEPSLMGCLLPLSSGIDLEGLVQDLLNINIKLLFSIGFSYIKMLKIYKIVLYLFPLKNMLYFMFEIR